MIIPPYLMREQEPSIHAKIGIAFGIGTDKPVPVDYDGDGKTDITVFQDGNRYIPRTTAGFLGVGVGTATDKPVPNAYVIINGQKRTK